MKFKKHDNERLFIEKIRQLLIFHV